ncbi:dual specificity testis-specific protein kinase 2 isoform X1 [Diorhabda sublineata]|uniref:dual specificity testis-specific protein kinase 2 isoform X1 n=1 Tax=Diorhabda sublineata TaxID=1163346 RepID=UPI0024E10FD6|nr:dual specificity testis-specific protein kinase 2 isoform X1 [Diorhabda sublineata]
MYPLNKNETINKSKISCIYDSPCDPKDSDYEKLFCPNNELSEPPKARCDRLKTGSSCQALKHAVAALHPLDDFHKEKIGEGFFSEVFKVTHQTTGQVMVLKMNTRHSNRRNMLKEIQLMNRLSHQNILRLKGVCVHKAQLHALTEYIDGGSLHQLIHNRSVEIEQQTRIEIARDIASGMEYLHSKGVIHRDLTSKNVLIKHLDSGKLRAVVGDFGLSTDIPDPKEKTKLPIVGSPYWISPEGLKGKYYDERSDVFSYGIVLCELIARVEADPDYLPRTDNFGLDYLAFSDLCGPNVVPEFLTLAFRCCSVDPKSRPTFKENFQALADLLNDMKLAEDKRLRMANCAAKSEEQLTVVANAAANACAPQHRKIVHRRSFSEDTSLLSLSFSTPSDKARRHALLMCRQDPHYKPSTTNPFAGLAQFQGVKKLLGNFSSCCEMACPLTESKDSPKSLPGSPTSSRKAQTIRSPLFVHPMYKGGSGSNLSELTAETSAGLLRRRGSCESGFYSSVGECLSPNSMWGDSTAVSSIRSLDELEHAELQALCKRASSIYTDSSEDISSLTSCDWQNDLKPNISSIVEYFERKGTSLRHPGGSQLSSRIASLRRSLERHNTGSTCTASTHLALQRPKCSRLVICEGAVRSKLPLFDKNQMVSKVRRPKW